MTIKSGRIIALETAIDRAGGIMRFSRQIGCSHQAVYAWKKRGHVPPEMALCIENLYSVPREDLMSATLAAVMAAPPIGAADVL